MGWGIPGRATLRARILEGIAMSKKAKWVGSITLIAASVTLALVLAPTNMAAQGQARRGLDVYIIDVEGGNAVLFVSPSGESLLMDTGNVPPGAARYAGRIIAATKAAGLKQIDHLIITH